MSGAVEGVALLETLIPKLRAMVDSGHRTLGGGTVSYNGISSIWGNEPIMKLANPDGPEVAAAIEHVIASLTSPPARSYADGMAIEALESIADFAEVRLKDGDDMGARIWRIALEDIVRDARAALSQGGKA
jgi:hypothetical protein